MMKAGVPLLQSFDIVARGSTNPRMTKLLNDIRSDVETGTSLSSAFRKHPLHFDSLYCNLVEAGEAGGILEACSTAWRSTRKRRWPSSPRSSRR
jgi:type IV pilus assembly protein PilC